jgi:hypothetical protein
MSRLVEEVKMAIGNHCHRWDLVACQDAAAQAAINVILGRLIEPDEGLISAYLDEMEREPPSSECFSGNPQDWPKPFLRAIADHLSQE